MDPALDPERRAHAQFTVQNAWEAERNDVMNRFMEELRKATGDGSKKRQSGMKPPWYADPSHEAAIFSHLMKWKKGEQKDKDSGAHPLVHAAWRCLAIACAEIGNVPNVRTKKLAMASKQVVPEVPRSRQVRRR